VPKQNAVGGESSAALEVTDADTTTQTTALALPKDFGRKTGDWDEIVKRGVLRVLTVGNKSGFFYDKGHPRGIVVEAMEAFAEATNKKLKTKAKKFTVTFLPLPPGQLQKALTDGTGDIICVPVIITPERENSFDFTIPIRKDVKIVVVTSKAGPAVGSIDDFGGKVLYVHPVSVAVAELEKVNQRLKQAGKPVIGIKQVDSNLTEEDLLEMVNANLIPATVAMDFRAELWSKVFDNVVVTPAIVKDMGPVGWVMRKGSPQLKAEMDGFIKTHGQGTVFSAMMWQKYIKNNKWVKDSTSEKELKKFQTYLKFFQQYAAEYNFNYLMLAAQGYQESMLNQERVSPRGAVGVMQVLPKYAAADPINISNVRNAQDNIHAGAKMLAHITNTYFNDPGIDQMNKTLLTFAAYNAGPNRIVRLRKETQAQGLNPNKWFGNVELMVSKDVGQETVNYVSNIYKYYVAYEMGIEQKKAREQGKQATLQGK
jgi:membrane-bound lytic murein transglycosylase MltF